MKERKTIMKATGIVRRIDELGRIVIPKEIRNTLSIKEGDPLEMYLGDEHELVMKPYRPEGLTFKHIESGWQLLSIDERQELLCELVNHINDPEGE